MYAPGTPVIIDRTGVKGHVIERLDHEGPQPGGDGLMADDPEIVWLIAIGDGCVKVTAPPPEAAPLPLHPDCQFKVGDRVRLNRHGLRQVHGLKTPEELEAQRAGAEILAIEAVATDPPCSYVELSGPLGRPFITDLDIEHA